MAETAGKNTASFMRSQTGRIEPVLIETKNKNGLYEGYTMNYTPVFIKADDSYVGKIVNVKLTEAFDDHCKGIVRNQSFSIEMGTQS